MKRPDRPNYEKMYPTASADVIAYLKTSDRQMEYQSYDLKVERYKVDQLQQTVRFIPSREDSLERLMDNSAQFKAQEETVEDVAIRNVMAAELHKALESLTTDELELIYALFFEDVSEISFAKSHGVNQSTINRRKVKVMAKIKKFLEI